MGAWILPAALVIRLIPGLIQPAIKRVVRLALHWCLYRSLEERIFPMVADKLARTKHPDREPDRDNTLLQWYIDALHKGDGDQATQSPRFITS